MKYLHWSKIELRELIPNNAKALLRVVSSLRSRNFRLYFLGQCVSLCGSWIQNIAMSWLVYSLTNSVFLLTAVTFLNLLPSFVLTPFSGVLSDRFNKYRIILTTQSLFMAQASLLAVLTLTGVVQVWHLLTLSTFAGIISAVEAPARQSFYTRLVPKQDMSNAIALNSVTINGSRFIGPTIGGILISVMGEGYCFLVNALSYIAVLAALLMMKLPKYVPNKQPSHAMRQLKDGVVYVKNYLPIKAVLIFIAVISFFGMPFLSVVPAVVKDILGGDSSMLGSVMSSVGAGSMTAAIYLAARKYVKGLGKVVTISAFMFGVGLILVSFIKIPFFVYMVCFPIGFGMIATAASCNTLLQTLVDDDKRGRVMSFYTMAFAGMNPLGSLFAGAVAKYIGVANVLLGGGIICVIAAGVYEYYRPAIRAAARDPYTRDNVIPEIAMGMRSSNNNPF